MSIGRRLLVAVTLIAALGVPAVALAKAPVTISGDVTLTTTGASGGNRLVVKLLERTSGGAVIERAVTETAIGENALPPYRFTLPAVDSSALNRAGSTYSIQATIALKTSIRFQDSKAYTPDSTARSASQYTLQPAICRIPPAGMAGCCLGLSWRAWLAFWPAGAGCGFARSHGSGSWPSHCRSLGTNAKTNGFLILIVGRVFALSLATRRAPGLNRQNRLAPPAVAYPSWCR